MLKKRYIMMFWLLGIVSACSNIKYLPEGEQLYVGAKVKVEDDSLKKAQKKTLRSELEGLTQPKPNSTILGLRPKLWFYNIAGQPKKEKGLRYWLKNKVGEPPVLMSKVDLEYNASLIQNRMENHGYFRAQTEADSTSRNRRVTAEYTAFPGPQYQMRKIVFPQDSTVLASAIKNTEQKTLLKPGEAYDLDKIKAERNRIDTRLKEQGFFYFGPDYIIAKADSTVGTHQVDILLETKPQTPEKATQVYTIDDIYIYPNYSLRDTLLNKDEAETYKDYKVIDRRHTFKPRTFEKILMFEKGDIYNRTDHNLTLNRLVNMGTFKFVKNQFRPSDSDSLNNKLDAYYYLTPLPKKSIRFEALGKTNSANYSGTEFNVNWSNRNAFRGAELLTLSGFAGFEAQVAGQNQGYNILRFGGDASLIWPRFIAPFKINSHSAFVPKTKATLGYEIQRRSKLYNLNTFKGSFGYLWKENVRKEHELKVFDGTYVNSFGVTQEYLEKIDSVPSLARVIEKQLIIGPSYTFTYTNTMETAKTHTFYYKGGIDLAGTLLGLFNKGDVLNGDTARLFSVPFSQYAKIDNDFRYYLKINDRNKIATRAFVGIGLPYSNSSALPYIKQYFAGGTNSIRAFRARSVGPGTTAPNTEPGSFIPDQSGDYRLELNAEYRPKLFSIVEGAIFVDAGNVWLAKEDPERPGAAISKDFMKELAVGAGVGLRIDLSFLILRGDLAFPIRKPYLSEGNRWVVDQIDFGSRQWRKENLVFNLAIGYPF